MSRYSFIAYLAILTLLTSFAYRHFRGEWISFRHGEQFLQTGDIRNAVESFAEAWKRGMRSDGLIVAYHDTLLLSGQATAAVEIFRCAFSDSFRRNVIEVLIEREAEQGSQNVLAALAGEWTMRHPSDRQARITAARVYGRLGRFNEAEQEYRLALGETKHE